MKKLIFLLLPAMLGTRPVMNAVGEGLRMPGWSALGVGVVLLALHWLVRQRSAVKLPKVDRRNAPHRVSQTINQVEPTLEPSARIAHSPDAAPALAHERLTRWSPDGKWGQINIYKQALSLHLIATSLIAFRAYQSSATAFFDYSS